MKYTLGCDGELVVYCHVRSRGMLRKPRQTLCPLSLTEAHRPQRLSQPSRPPLLIYSSLTTVLCRWPGRASLSHFPSLKCFGSDHNKVWPRHRLYQTNLPLGKPGAFKAVDPASQSSSTRLSPLGCSCTHCCARWMNCFFYKPSCSHLPDTLEFNPELPSWAFLLPWPCCLTPNWFNLFPQAVWRQGVCLTSPSQHLAWCTEGS